MLKKYIITPESPRYHPTVISFTPASVVITYSLNDLQEATNLAQQFCSTINKDAQYTGHNIQDTIYRTQYTGHNIQDTIYRTQYTGHNI